MVNEGTKLLMYFCAVILSSALIVIAIPQSDINNESEGISYVNVQANAGEAVFNNDDVNFNHPRFSLKSKPKFPQNFNKNKPSGIQNSKKIKSWPKSGEKSEIPQTQTDHEKFTEPAYPGAIVFVKDKQEIDFSYKYNNPAGPSNWAKLFKNCGGIRQSPIALDSHKCQHVVKTEPITIKLAHRNPKTVTITNTGLSIDFTFTWRFDEPPYLIYGPNGENYNFSRYHFHFGKNDFEGSEHTLESVRYPLEMHLIFLKAKYETITDALKDPSGVIAVGVMFIVTPKENNYGLLNYLPEFKWPNTQKTYQYSRGQQIIDFRTLLQSDYFTYEGSLTIPECNESVIWFVDTKVRKISISQMKLFRNLVGKEEQMAGNFRPLQQLNNRTCTYYY